jgi:uncharacterized coiled-coil DUF342 family protein
MTAVTSLQRRPATEAAFSKLESELVDSIATLTEPYREDREHAPAHAAAHPDIGRLSADAVLEQYKMAAKSVEEMGIEVTKRIAALEAALTECHKDMKLIKEAADAISEKGKFAHAEIERTSAVSSDIRSVVQQIMGKLT